MANYNTKYERSVSIDSFQGLNQTGDGYNSDMRYAYEIENVNVSGGSFQPMREGLVLEQSLGYPIGTLAYLHVRHGTNAGTTYLVAVSDGTVYTKVLDGDDNWEQRYPPPVGEGETQTVANLQKDSFSWITYEVNRQSDTYPVDVLLFTNDTDGLYCLYSDDLHVAHVAVTPDPVDHPTEDYHFGIIARYNERIWGTGLKDDPDMLMYSVPYDPFDWRPNTTIPEDGAGSIQQPTWDGDRFVTIRQHGSDLLAIKRNSIWRIYGTNPGEFNMQRQYGGGTIVAETLATFGEYAYMLGEHGMIRYDGSEAYEFLQDNIWKLMRENVNHAAMSVCRAAMRGRTYCLSLPLNGSSTGNAILEYDTLDRTISLRTEISVENFMIIDERLFYTTSTQPGHVFELRDDIGRSLPCKWVSGYQDLGVKSSIKSAFTLYASIECETPVELRLALRTEKKVKRKIVTVKPGKVLRAHLNTHGRIFRLEISCYSAAPFVIAGGLKLDMELDPD